MELKTIEDIKKELGNKVKFSRDDNVSENLKALDVLEGTLIKVTAIMDYMFNIEVCWSWTAYIDIVDPKDGGLHHLTATRVFSLDEKDGTIINIKAIEEIAILEATIITLEAGMVEVSEITEEEIL